ncbi:MAG: tRNA pseudouridine(38-40) synthase TruA, partial [Acidobacteriota bacterium]
VTQAWTALGATDPEIGGAETGVARLTVAYDGGAYSGWQRQPNAMTVQQRVEEALEGLFGEPVRIVGSGRTDAGVHAIGQTAHFTPPKPMPPKAWVHATNHRLPRDIRVTAGYRMAAGFHAQRSAVAKSYVYRLYRGRLAPPTEAPFVALAPVELDLDAVRRAMAALPGQHDFSAFALAGGSHTDAVRRLFAATVDGCRDGFGNGAGPVERRVTLRFVGEGFLRGMVRSLVGTLIEIGRGDRDVTDMARLLEPGRTRDEAGFTADACGLHLERVYYGPEWRPIEAYEA